MKSNDIFVERNTVYFYIRDWLRSVREERIWSMERMEQFLQEFREENGKWVMNNSLEHEKHGVNVHKYQIHEMWKQAFAVRMLRYAAVTNDCQSLQQSAKHILNSHSF